MPATTSGDEEIPLAERPGREMERYRRIFQQVDANNSGYVNIWELEDFINSNAPDASVIPKECCYRIHKMCDKNGDRKLDFDEFIEMIEHPDLQHLFGQYVDRYVNFLVPMPVQKTTAPTAFAASGGRLLQRQHTVDSVEKRHIFEELTCCPPPIYMLVISILEVTLHLVDEFTKKDFTLSGTGITASVLMYDPNKRHEIWRFLTYMLVHIGWSHLIVNVGVQLLLGIPLEMVHRWWRVLVIYFSGVVAGSLAHSITDPSYRLAGASGGVYSLLTAHIASVIMNWSNMTFPIIQMVIFTLIVACDLGQSIYDRYFLDINSQVGISAHVGGAVAGLLVGIYALRNLEITKMEKYIWWIALILYMLLMGTAIVLNLAVPSMFK